MTTPKTDALMALADRYAFHIPGSQHSDEARAVLFAALQKQARDQQGPIKTWQERIEETCPALGPMHIHACVEEVNDAMQAEIDDLRAAMQAREGEADLSNLSVNAQSRIREWIADGTFVERAIGVISDQERELAAYEKAAAPQPAQPESIECDCGRIHKKTRYGWACSEPAQPEQGEREILK